MIFWDLVEVLMIFSDRGELFVWGKNVRGCLGIGKRDDQYFPWRVRTVQTTNLSSRLNLIRYTCAGGERFENTQAMMSCIKMLLKMTRTFSAGDCTRSYGGRCMWCGSYGGAGQISHMSSKSCTEHSSSKKQCE